MNDSQEKIDYEVKRSQRSTADIIVERDGSILVRAPESLPDERIDALVESKRYWILKTLAEWRDLNSARVVREFHGGEGFLYLGRTYRLSLVSDQSAPLILKNGWLCLRRDLAEEGDDQAARKAFIDFYTEKAKQRIAGRVDDYAPKVGVQFNEVVIRDLGNRWASCSPSGNLAFHWKCMMAPLSIIDYIVVHELCHLLERDHTKAFWNEVDKVMPSFKERRQWLRENGASLDV